MKSFLMQGFSSFLLLLLGLSALPGLGQSSTAPLNILWIIGEDLGPELACYGHPEVHTPNLDRLAAQGVRYTHAYTTAPVCSPSRSALHTGMYQTTIGAHNHRSHREDGYELPEGVQVITDRFRAAGYYTANLVQLSDDPQESYFRGTGKTDWNFHYEGEPFDGDQFSDLPAHEPFFAEVNFPETHRGHEWDHAHEHINTTADPAKVKLPPYYPDHPEARAVWAQYLNAVMSLDRKVGYVLDRLEELGLAERTLVVFMGDHGRAMVRGKQWPYESGLHIPLILRWPKAYEPPAGYEAGMVDDRLLAHIDITATSLSLAGIQPPLLMQGRVFLGDRAAPERQYVFGGRDRGDETVDRIRTVRDGRFRYIRNFYPERPFLQTNRYKEFTYPIIPLMRELQAEGQLTPAQARLLAPTRPVEELYDLEKDPYEIFNLADDPSYAARLRSMRALVDAWIMETNDQGRTPESREIHEYWEKRLKANYDERIKKMLRERAERAGGK